MNRGERVTKKTKSAIKNGLLELMREKNYPDITVGDITKRGDVGRSTLYKHYKSKADVLVDIHRDIFEFLFRSLSTSQSWCDPEPPAELISFFEKHQKLGRNPFSLSYKLGSDLDFLISKINLQLSLTIGEKLHASFRDEELKIPLPILAQSISNLYSGLIMYWFNQGQSVEIREFATNMHRMARALIFEGLGKV